MSSPHSPPYLDQVSWQNSRALTGRQAGVSSKSNREKPGVARHRISAPCRPMQHGCDFTKSGAGELARGFDAVCGVAADQRVVVPDRLGLAEEIALHRVAALVRE